MLMRELSKNAKRNNKVMKENKISSEISKLGKFKEKTVNNSTDVSKLTSLSMKNCVSADKALNKRSEIKRNQKDKIYKEPKRVRNVRETKAYSKMHLTFE